MSGRHLADAVQPREVLGWVMYDFANSGYTTVVITAIYNAWFVAAIAGNAPWATLAWTAALSVSYALIMASAPVLGAWADVHGAKKRVLAWTTAGCVLCTAALAWPAPGEVALAMLLVILSNFCFGAGENVVAAFLPELARGEAMGKVSAWGWSVGYLGGLLTLALCLGWIHLAQGRGMSAAQFVPVTALITAALFALASLPTFLWLRERARPLRQSPQAARLWVRRSWSRAWHTFTDTGCLPDLRRLLVCMVFYQAGIQTVIALAAIYAQQALGFGTADTIQLVLVVNLTAAAGAFAFGQLQDRLGHSRTIALTLVGWLLMTLIAWQSETRASFWVAANIAGVCLGSSQSAGRALVGYLSPPGRQGEMFGLWGLAVKLSAILGPLTYGLVSWMSAGNHRLAMLVTGLFFVAGLALLTGIDVPRGRRMALAAPAANKESAA